MSAVLGSSRARAAAPSPARTAPSPGVRRPNRLELVPPPRRRPARTPFVLLVLTVLGTGLVALLLLNTGLAQDSFELTDLRQKSGLLTDREEALEQEIAQLSTPERLAAEAERLGMRPGDDPRFITVPAGASQAGQSEPSP